ncbi:hypothetical protein GQ457_07G016320 [Hibiscus cannabinus]
MNNTDALDMLPYSERTCLVARSFSGLRANLASTWSNIAGPPGNKPRNILAEMKRKPHFTKVTVDGVVTVRQDRLSS